MAQEQKFRVYKGLQQPLVFKNLKGRYIGWAAGLCLTAFILCVIAGNMFGIVCGLVVLVAIPAIGLMYINGKQKEGLHDKPSNAGIFAVSRVLRGRLNV